MGQRNYFTTSITVLYELPLVAVLSITGNNNVIFHSLRQYQFRTVLYHCKVQNMLVLCKLLETVFDCFMSQDEYFLSTYTSSNAIYAMNE